MTSIVTVIFFHKFDNEQNAFTIDRDHDGEYDGEDWRYCVALGTGVS